MELSDFNELFHVNLESDSNMATIGGWLIEKLGEIPKSGTKVQKEGFFFHVLSASPRKIKTLYIRKSLEKKE
jgi:CBS domain containing-hemolysin-like protein